MKVKIIYSDEVMAQLKILKRTLRDYEKQLDHLIDKKSHLTTYERNELFDGNRGRLKLIKAIKHIKKNAVIKDIVIIDYDRI